MEVIVNHLGDVQFEVKARRHTVYCDQPVEDGGYDEGMTPPEFFLASLATCAGYYAAKYAKGHGLAAEGLRVRVTAAKAKNPARLEDFRIFVEHPGPIEERHREGLLRAVQSCLIHNTLLHSPKVTTEVRGQGAGDSGQGELARAA